MNSRNSLLGKIEWGPGGYSKEEEEEDDLNFVFQLLTSVINVYE
jgi:hypothetical protein